MIARVTGALSDEAARQVEAAVLGRAGWLTLGQLHAALRRAVIKADPKGAERRRREVERKAQVVLYPEDEGTATLAGYALPGVQAAAAMARITALAKAMQAAGNGGRIDLVRARVFLGLLLGTLPYIPPPVGSPPDDPPPDAPGPGEPADDAPPAEPADGWAPGDWAGAGNGADDLAWPWPGVLPCLLPAPGTLAGIRPLPGTGGLLGVMVPLGTLTGASSAPGQLSRRGVIMPGQARQHADLAARHPATRWRTDQLASASGHDPPGTVPPGSAVASQPTPLPGSPLAKIVDRAIDVAGRAAAAAEQRRQDERSDGCGHGLASAAYRPPPRIADLVIARDGTCRFGPCRRPAEQCDLDHSVPFDQGGPTCECNLGGKCRTHHQLKQHPGWSVPQSAPGIFRWITPAGRAYITCPDPYVT